MKAGLCEWLGYIFCEFSFRWFDRFDVPLSEVDEEDLTPLQRLSYFIGSKPYGWGVYFYNFGG